MPFPFVHAFHPRLIAMSAAVLLLTPAAWAIPPAAPTNVKASVSLKVANGTTALAHDKYLVTWTDNAVDETGYRLEIRFGNVGQFLTLALLEPNTEGVLWTPTASQFSAVAGQIIQFRVIAFKYNAAAVELRSGPIQTLTYPSTTGNISTPTGLTAVNVGDGGVRLEWNDTSNAETYHQVFYKKSSEGTYQKSFYIEHNISEVDLRSGRLPPSKLPHLLTGARANAAVHFEPGATYNFRVRSVVRLNQDTGNFHNSSEARNAPYDSDLSNPVSITIPVLSPPTELSGSVVDQSSIRLSWVDNSSNETGYKIEYKAIGTSTWTTLGSANGAAPPSSTSYTVNIGSGVTLDWRVSAVYSDPVSGSVVATSATSNEYPIGTTFPGPGNLTATDTGYSGKILLEWQDNAEAETNYEISARVKGTTTWRYVTTLAADARRAHVSQAEFDGASLSDFPKGEALEFLVEAVVYVRDSNGNAISRVTAQDGATVEATARHGFTSRPYHPISEGVFFTYTATTSNADERVSWNVTGLPDGVTFDSMTGIISGTPAEAGHFPSVMTATFSDGHVANAILNLRVLPASSEPQTAAAIQNVTLAPGVQFFLPLADKFSDTDSKAAARLRTTLGEIDILLYPDLAPQSVQNFLHYINNGGYNGVVFHRSVPDFIIQGGSYRAFQAPDYFVKLDASRPSPLNEPGISNLRGTVAWAKLPGTADSATLDFFFNLGNNAENLDNQNEGFAAFGRVVGAGMDLVDDIAGFPIGTYRNFNAAGGTNAALDKRVNLVDFSESGQPFLSGQEALDAVPMNTEAENAPLDMDVNQTVRILQAAQISPLGYSVPANTAPDVVSAFVSGGNLVIQGLKEGVSSITVQAADLDGHLVTQTFTVTIVRNYKAPVITKQPVSVAVLPGADAKLAVTATGTGPLNYQWMKDGQDINGENSAKLTVTAVDAGKTGFYAVRVWNNSLTVLSNVVRVDLRAPPVFTTHPVAKVVEAGKPLELEVNGTGAPVPAISWLRSGKVVAKQTSTKLSIPSAKIADGGVYTARASNVVAKNVSSQPAEVLVVDKGARLAFAPAGRKLALQAQAAAGPGLLHQWLRNGGLLLTDTDNVTGVQGPVLTIKALGFGDLGSYTCQVLSADGSLTAETGPWKVSIPQKPVLQNFTAATAYVGLDYEFTPAFGGDANNSVASFSIKGLPGGLKNDTATARIFGRPTHPGVFTLTVTGKNPAGTSAPVTGMLIVTPMPEPAVGTFVGQVAASSTLNGGKGGRMDFTVTDGGLVSGKLTVGKDAFSFKGTMRQTPGSSLATGEAVIARKGGALPVTFTFSIFALQGFADSGNFEGTLSDGVTSAQTVGYRKVFHATWNPYSLPQSYNLGLNLANVEDVDKDAIPQGSGFLRVVTNTSGDASITGRLADGTTLTCSSPLGGVLAGGQNIRFLVYQSLYKHTGAIVGEPGILVLQLAPAGVNDIWFRVSGQLRWTRDAQNAAAERAYKPGFGPVILDALGMTYTPPASGSPVFRLPKSGVDNARMEFEHGGIEHAATDPDVPLLTITNANGVSIAAANNPGGVKLTITPGTGLLSGSFTVEDDPAVTPKRGATFHGIIVPQIPDFQIQQTDQIGNTTPVEVPGSPARGIGHFLLAQKPSAGPPATTAKTSPILSGIFRLLPAPITINTQPQGATKDPGENHTFTVAVTAPGGTVTYQWRKNGLSITGATNATLVLTGISEGNEGTYDVVISTEYSRVVSDPAVLNVNNIISEVIITRSPSDEVLDEGGSVTFTAVANGSGTLTYQWRKDGDDIEGATSSTYIIDELMAVHSGQYSVRVTSALTPGGFVSNVLDLQVATGVVNPLLARLPATTDVSIGSSVTFTVTPDGRPPHFFTWFKDGELIEGASNAPNYIIHFVTQESAGNYSVLVSNALTPEGVYTNTVPLGVDDKVSNVVATRAPDEEAVAESTAVEFTVTHSGAGPFTYQWYKNDVPIDNATGISHSLPAALEADSGNYRVRVFNASTPEGVLSDPVPLVVAQPVSSVSAALTLPLEGPIVEGGTFRITATANGSEPRTYQWYRGGVPIDGATGSQLTISGATPEDHDGEYAVSVSNPVTNEEFSNNVSIQVQPEP